MAENGPPATGDLLAEAAAWHTRLAESGAAPGARHASLAAACLAWRQASPAHDAAYARVSSARNHAEALAAQAPLLALRQQTLARTMLARRPPPARRAMLGAVLVALVATPLAAFTIHAWRQPATGPRLDASWHTAIGQRRDLVLPDGSQVTLDTDSRLEAHYAGTQRQLRLEGQGWFQIKPGASPLRITAGGQTFTADTGTFDIRTDPGRLRAYAASGHLNLIDADTSAPGPIPDRTPDEMHPILTLAPGHLLALHDQDVVLRELSQPAGFIGWHQGLLQFDNVPLGAAVAEFNRYRPAPIRVDGRAAALRISGAFRPGDSTVFLDALATGFPLRVRPGHAGGVTLSLR